MATGEHIKSEDFDRYISVFKKDLTIEQVALIRELFKDHAVRELVRAERPLIVCLQKTKMSVISDFDLI